MLLLGVHAAWAVGFGDESVQVSEAALSVLLIVERQSENTGAFAVDYATANRTATAGQDYVATSGTLEFVEGQMVQEIIVLLLNDTLRERSESFSVQLSNITGGFDLGIGSTMVFVEDNDNGVGF
jgi:hypothetical protein